MIPYFLAEQQRCLPKVEPSFRSRTCFLCKWTYRLLFLAFFFIERFFITETAFLMFYVQSFIQYTVITPPHEPTDLRRISKTKVSRAVCISDSYQTCHRLGPRPVIGGLRETLESVPHRGPASVA